MFYGIPDTRRKNKRHLRFWRGAAGVVILWFLHSTTPMSGRYFLVMRWIIHWQKLVKNILSVKVRWMSVSVVSDGKLVPGWKSKESNARDYDSVLSLKMSIKKAASTIHPMVAQRACGTFRRWLEIVQKAHGTQWARSPQKCFLIKNRLIVNSTLRDDSDREKTALMEFWIIFPQIHGRVV